jgi:hypothetical protein
MKIPFFEIAALLFLLWPLIQRFLGKQKPAEEQYHEQDFDDEIDYNLPPPIEQREAPQNWQEAMKELDMIFGGGQPPVKQAPPPQPIVEAEPMRITRNQNFKRSSESLRATRPLSESSVYTTSSKQKSKEFKSDDLVDELMSSDNAIYQSLDKEVTIEDGMNIPTYSVFTDVRNPAKLREFYVIKEILDKPVSRRRTRNFV